MAGLGKKTFVAGEVLLAQDVNGYLMDQSVMVFGGTAARSSAIPTPTEGMMSYRTDDDVVEVFDGSAYVGVGGGASGALTLISKTTIGTSVASVNVTSAFSSAYRRYKVFIAGSGTNTNDGNLAFKLGSSTTGYYWAGAAPLYATSTISNNNGNNQASFSSIGFVHPSRVNLDLELIDPGVASFTKIVGARVALNGAANYAGSHDVATAFTDFTITPSAGTMTGGTIYVYGYED
jgi:hypothetical protein